MRLATLVGLAMLVSFAVTGNSQEIPARFGQGSSSSASAPRARAAQLSSGRLITVEVTIAETPVVGSGREMSPEKIAELDKAGKLVSQSRYWASLVENQRSELQFSDRVQVVVGRTNVGGGRPVQEQTVYENVGTKLGLVGRTDGDSVLVQLELDQTRLIPSPKPEGEAEGSISRPRLATTTFQSTLTIPPGKTIIAGGRETQTDKGNVQTWLLISAHAEGAKPDAAPGGSPIKIFRLLDAKAEEMAMVVQSVFSREGIQVAVDSRTNSLIVRGDEKSLEVIHGILSGLDQKDLTKKEEKKSEDKK